MTDTVKTINMYYDKYECEFGDGFYPLLKGCDEREQAGLIPIQITFRLIGLIWKQINGPNSICGLDGDTGQELIKILNDNEINAKTIISLTNKQIYPKK